MTFCNNAKVLPPEDGKGWRVIGDPTEGCLLVAADKGKFDLQAELIAHAKIYELPFDSVRKRMSVVHVEGEGQRAYVKGAPSETIGLCTRIGINGQDVPLNEEPGRTFSRKTTRCAGGAAGACHLRARPACGND